jgi:hypothetical protein
LWGRLQEKKATRLERQRIMSKQARPGTENLNKHYIPAVNTELLSKDIVAERVSEMSRS